MLDTMCYFTMSSAMVRNRHVDLSVAFSPHETEDCVGLRYFGVFWCFSWSIFTFVHFAVGNCLARVRVFFAVHMFAKANLPSQHASMMDGATGG